MTRYQFGCVMTGLLVIASHTSSAPFSIGYAIMAVVSGVTTLLLCDRESHDKGSQS